MPELPEVQTTVNGLQTIINHQITKVTININKMRYLIPNKIKIIAKNKRILKIYRLAKYIIFDLSDNVSLVFHLGMSGRLRIIKLSLYKNIKHDHILIILNNNKIIIFNDPRKFGVFDIFPTLNIRQKKYFVKLGLDPFDKKLKKKYLLAKFNKSRIPIKQLLINQTIISGIGNIYANEILFDAKISPFIPACFLNSQQINQLIRSSRQILKKAIFSGGASMKDYVSTDGTLGNFQTKFKVYNKKNDKKSKSKIFKINQYGRATFFCPSIQKSKYNPFK